MVVLLDSVVKFETESKFRHALSDYVNAIIDGKVLLDIYDPNNPKPVNRDIPEPTKEELTKRKEWPKTQRDTYTFEFDDNQKSQMNIYERQGIYFSLLNYFMDFMPDYLSCLETGFSEKIHFAFDKGFPINFQNPFTGETTLHALAGIDAKHAILSLLAKYDFNFLLRDNKGRLISEIAYLYGEDAVLARLLGNYERKQAEAQGVKLTRRPLKQ